jgi:hypothetical protein
VSLLPAAGCSKRSPPDEAPRGAAKIATGAPSADPAELHPSDEPRGEVNAATRCAECHGELHAQWKASRHARAATSDLYVRTRKLAAKSECARCHEPLAKLVEADHPAARDGVNCDACHTLAAVDVGGESAAFQLRPEERTKFGPLCDAVDHYFHKMGCSPLHGESRFCASCHHWSENLQGGVVRLLGEYEEWRESAYAKKGTSCQDCHMPWSVAPVAAGAATRVNASHHGFWGEGGELRKRSLAVKAAVDASGDRLKVRLVVKNAGAGHYVPTGVPDHRVVLEAALLDATGTELERAERTYGKVLVDANGAPAPFFRASKQTSDTRIAPEEERNETLEFATAKGGATVKIRIIWQDIATDIARTLEYEPTREVMYEESLALRNVKGSPRRDLTTPAVNR